MTAGHEVVIAGGGPTGLMLAGELALAGVDVVIVERRATQELEGWRALGLHSRAIEVLDQRGIADRFVSQGQTYPIVHFHMPLSISDFPTRHNYVLGLRQNHIERILAEWIGELRVPIRRGCEVTGFAQDEAGVAVEMSDGESLRAEYLVGCDGGRSVIRKAAGIEFTGWDASMSWLLAEVQVTEEPAWGFRHDAIGTHAGLDVHYDLGEGHPLLGRRMPDLDLVTSSGPMRVYSLLHGARPVLLNLGEPDDGFDITPWADRVQRVDARYTGPWELPVLGAVTPPNAVLVRPDGYVAWVGDLADPKLPDALTTWFGPRR